MAKKQTAKHDDPDLVVKYDAQTIATVALKVKAEGFVPVAALRDEFGPEKATQAVAVLYRDFRLFREVRRPWSGGEALGYEWADRRFSRQEVSKIPPNLGFIVELTQGLHQKYTDFQEVALRCRFTTPILGSVPVKNEHGDPTNTFERDQAGHALILRYHQRAMARAALPLIGREQVIAPRIGWSTIRIPINGNLKIVEHGIVEQGRPGGKGLRRSECLPDGIEFTMRAMVPTSVLPLGDFVRLVRVAGQHIGLSPGRSSGFGDFEVLGEA